MRQLTRRKSIIVATGLVAMLMSLSALLYFQGVAFGAQLSPNFVANTVVGSINTGSPGHESFWSQITPVQVPLTATDDYGGNTQSVTLKMATNGTHLLVLATWSDPTQDNRSSGPTIEAPDNPGLFLANSTYHYQDRFVIWWSLNQNPGPPPCMTDAAPGKGAGASIVGSGNLWQWKAASTDSGGYTFGKGKYGAGTPNAGTVMPYPHSYASNELLNTTGHFTLGFDSARINSTVGYDSTHTAFQTYLIWAHGVYDRSAKTWTFVAARSLQTSPTQYTVQFQQDKTYYFALAVFDGGPIPIPAGVAHPANFTGMGNSDETKSISSWNTMALAPSSGGNETTTQTTSQASQPTGITFETAAIVSFALLVVGFAAGMAVTYRFAAPKRSQSSSVAS